MGRKYINLGLIGAALTLSATVCAQLLLRGLHLFLGFDETFQAIFA